MLARSNPSDQFSLALAGGIVLSNWGRLDRITPQLSSIRLPSSLRRKRKNERSRPENARVWWRRQHSRSPSAYLSPSQAQLVTYRQRTHSHTSFEYNIAILSMWSLFRNYCRGNSTHRCKYKCFLWHSTILLLMINYCLSKDECLIHLLIGWLLVGWLPGFTCRVDVWKLVLVKFASHDIAG